MPGTKEPNSGLNTFENYTPGQSGWGSEQVANWKRLGRVGFHLAVLDRDLTAPPAEPADGDRYIVAANATGAWEFQDNNIAVWDAGAGEAGEWVFFEPAEGWTAVILDEGVLAGYLSGAWTAGVDLDPAA